MLIAQHGYLGKPSRDNFSLPKIAIRFNTTPHSYLTSSGLWTDTGAGTLFSNVISITKVVNDLTGSGGLNSNTGLIINEGNSDIPGDDLVGVSVGDPDEVRFFKRSSFPNGGSTTIPTIEFALSATAFGQGFGSDPENQYFLGDGGTSIPVYNYSGTLIENLSITNANPGQFYYDYVTGDLYITADTGQPIRRFHRQSGVWVLQQTYWFVSNEGGAYDRIFGKFVSQQSDVREQDYSGFKVRIWKNPLTGSENEGLVVDQRDGTIWKNSDDYFHGTIVNGNRLIHFDPRGVYKQFLRFPDMIRYRQDFVTTGFVSGVFGDEQLRGNDWNISPVINFKSYTGQQSLSNYFYEGAEFEFRGSGTAPTTTGRDYNPVADVDVYDAAQSNQGWGGTTPGSWQSTPTTNQYMQFRVKPIGVDAAAQGWTPENMSTKVIWSEMISHLDRWGLEEFDSYVNYGDEPTAGEFRSELLINKANTANNWTQATAGSKPRWVRSTNRTVFVAGNTMHYVLSNVAPVLAMTTADVHIIAHRTAITNTAIFFTAHNTANSNNRITLAWLPSTHATFPNGVAFACNDGSGNISLYGVASTRTDFPLITYRLGGTTNEIWIDGVQQTLTTISGSNTGQCFDDVSSANTVRIGRIQGGLATPFTVRDSTHEQTFLLVNTPTETDFTKLLTYTSALNFR